MGGSGWLNTATASHRSQTCQRCWWRQGTRTEKGSPSGSRFWVLDWLDDVTCRFSVRESWICALIRGRRVIRVPYRRTVKTASGATAVQIVYSSHRGSRDIEHIGSARDDAELELLKEVLSRQRMANK